MSRKSLSRYVYHTFLSLLVCHFHLHGIDNGIEYFSVVTLKYNASVDFQQSSHACMGSLQELWLLPTVQMHSKLIGNSKVAIDGSVHGCLSHFSLFWPWDGLATCTLPHTQWQLGHAAGPLLP